MIKVLTLGTGVRIYAIHHRGSTSGRTVEVMKYYSSRYGKKGIKRGERKALTKEEQIKVNKRAAEKKLRRLINENFQEGDTHLVLDYRKGEKTSRKEYRCGKTQDDFLRENAKAV